MVHYLLGEMSGTYEMNTKFLAIKYEDKRLLGDLNIRGRIILK